MAKKESKNSSNILGLIWLLSSVQTIWVTFKEFQFSQERKKSYNVPPNWLGAKVDPKFTMVKEVMKAESQKKPSFDLVFGF